MLLFALSDTCSAYDGEWIEPVAVFQPSCCCPFLTYPIDWTRASATGRYRPLQAAAPFLVYS
jgi:hypothetical protein